ncbi:MAG: flagellar biosynthetic protein FliR [Verrucomicrobiota bacterium]|nr:flagellar biosynthetic protein FliR [Verrucomicrobiota bacterium]
MEHVNSLNSIDTYANLLLTLPNLSPITVLSVFFLTLARILPIMTIAPFLGAKNIPMTTRMMFSVALVAIFLPQNLLTVTQEISYGLAFIGYILKELTIGFVLGFVASAPFFLAQMSGSLIDHSRGSSALQVNDPTTQSQTGPIGILYNYLLIAIFFSLNGPFLFFDGLANSYRIIPVDQIFSPTLFQMNTPFWKQMFHLAETMFDLSVQLAAPALIGILLTDLFLGIANRLAPQVQIVFLGISLKSWVGIALMTAAWTLVLRVMSKESITWIQSMNQMIQSFAAPS